MSYFATFLKICVGFNVYCLLYRLW